MYKRKGNNYRQPLAHQTVLFERIEIMMLYEYSLTLASDNMRVLTRLNGAIFLFSTNHIFARTLGNCILRCFKSRKQSIKALLAEL